MKQSNRVFKRLLPRTLLTIFFTLIVFVILVITMLIVGLLMFALNHFDYLEEHLTSSNIIIPIAFFGIVSIFIGTLVAAMVSGIPLGFIANLINGMDALSKGNYSIRIELGQNVIGQKIANSFNRLAEELGNTEMLRSDFVNNFSHEFKTPIVSITGFAKLVQKGNITQEKEQEYLQIIVDEMNRLASMSTNILDLTKIENQTILTDITRMNLSEQIRSSILLLQQKWLKKDIVFDLEYDETFIQANEEMLRQVWINLLDNSIKFSPEAEEIQVRINQTDTHTTVKISNKGEFITPEDIDRIFNKFWQADTSHSTQGSGIGLSIVKEVLQLHKGQVNVTSDTEFTTFAVTLPNVHLLEGYALR